MSFFPVGKKPFRIAAESRFPQMAVGYRSIGERGPAMGSHTVTCTQSVPDIVPRNWRSHLLFYEHGNAVRRPNRRYLVRPVLVKPSSAQGASTLRQSTNQTSLSLSKSQQKERPLSRDNLLLRDTYFSCLAYTQYKNLDTVSISVFVKIGSDVYLNLLVPPVN